MYLFAWMFECLCFVEIQHQQALSKLDQLRGRLQARDDFTVALPTTNTTKAGAGTLRNGGGGLGVGLSSAPISLVASLIVVMQLNVCRCWMATETSCEKIVSLARSDEGPNGWLSVLREVDVESAQKKADSLFRLMFKAAQQFTQGKNRKKYKIKNAFHCQSLSLCVCVCVLSWIVDFDV